MMTPSDDPVVALDEEAADLAPRMQPLADALQRKFDMMEEDAYAVAHVVAEQFGQADEVDDEELESEVRSIFYTLEAKKLLAFRRETYTIESGERRRAYFWRIRDDELQRIKDMVTDDESDTVYDELPRDAWSRAS